MGREEMYRQAGTAATRASVCNRAEKQGERLVMEGNQGKVFEYRKSTAQKFHQAPRWLEYGDKSLSYTVCGNKIYKFFLEAIGQYLSK